MKFRKLKRRRQAYWRPRLSDIMAKVLRKRSARLAANIMQNNALFARQTQGNVTVVTMMYMGAVGAL